MVIQVYRMRLKCAVEPYCKRCIFIVELLHLLPETTTNLELIYTAMLRLTALEKFSLSMALSSHQTQATFTQHSGAWLKTTSAYQSLVFLHILPSVLSSVLAQMLVMRLHIVLRLTRCICVTFCLLPPLRPSPDRPSTVYRACC